MGRRLPLQGKSLRASAAAVNSQLFVTGSRLRGGAAAFGYGEDLQDPHAIAQRKRDHAADANFLAGLLDVLAVDPDMAGRDQGLRQRAALRQADAVEIAVEPHV